MYLRQFLRAWSLFQSLYKDEDSVQSLKYYPKSKLLGEVDGSDGYGGNGGGFLAVTEMITCKFVDFMNSYK
jgi:hypothetical protein